MKQHKVVRYRKEDDLELMNVLGLKVQNATRQETCAHQESATLMSVHARELSVKCAQELEEAKSRTQAASRSFAQLASPQSGRDLLPPVC